MASLNARARWTVSMGAISLALLMGDSAQAQSNTATVRGAVAGATGGQVTARNVETGYTATVTIRAGGAYVLTGLPPGTYRLTAPGPNGTTISRDVIIGVGQNLTYNLDAPSAGAGVPDSAAAPAVPGADDGDEIVVTGTRLVETRTSEVATNISVEQIRTLPQTDRNFLSFAALAPGVRYNDGESDKSISSGGSTASQVNVFIDGQSLKNNVLEGGIAGQQNSRGNPFAQLAVQEFRVLTQNYKAEYEQAAAAIITAVTKSGTNEFHGEIFGSYTDRSLIEREEFDRRADRPKPAFERKQYGAALGGPIIRDRLFFFGAYEGNDQNRAFNVQIGNRTPENLARFGEFEGTFVSPFRQDLYFGKLTFQLDERQTIDLSYSRREETDIQRFGGQSAFEQAENRINVIDTYNFRHTYRGDSLVNEFSIDYVDYLFNPTALNPDLPTFDFQGVIIFGGSDSIRRVTQQSYTLRNDLTLTNVEFYGSHVIKIGAKYTFQDYDFVDTRNPQPRFFFQNDTARNLDFSFPARALLGFGNPKTSGENGQLGFYVQDDWEVNDNLTFNIGVRYDQETNQFNNKYITPLRARELLLALPETEYFRGEDFVTDGSDRPFYKGAIQPRIGFSYDIFDDQRTVIFGGYGRYFDRNAFNNSRDEIFRLQYTVGTFFFSRDGLPRDGNPTVIFQDSFLTREGLLALQASAQTGLPELFAVKNNSKPPRTDQFSLGVRQKAGPVQVSVTGSYILGQNGFTNLFATRNSNGSCCNTDLARSFGFSNVLIGVDELDTRYWGLYVKIEKPYTPASGWGFDIAYTLSKAEQNGNDLFSLDKPTPDEYGFRDRPGTERHVIVFSGIVDLPWDFRLSTLSTFSSGTAFQVFDATNGFAIDDTEIRSAFPDQNCLGVFARCEVNVTLEKQFALFGNHRLGFAVDVFNLFDNDNFGGFEGFIPPEGQPRFGQPSSTITLPRRVQFRAFYRF